MNKKIIIVVISIVIIVAGMTAAGIYINNKQFRPELPKPPVQPPKPDDFRNDIIPIDQDISIDEETGWQVYRNKEYKFEVKFPGDWRMGIYASDSPTLTGGIGENDNTVITGFNFAPKTVPYDPLINLYIEYIEPESLEEKLKKLVEVAGWKIEQEKPRANGINIVKIYSEDALPGYGFIYYGYIFENQGLVFSFMGGGERVDTTDVFEKMMDSFRFIE